MKIIGIRKLLIITVLVISLFGQCSSSDEEEAANAQRLRQSFFTMYLLDSLFRYSFTFPPYAIYYLTDNVFYVGLKITDISPVNLYSSGAYTYQISPALPSGLSLNTSTGVISGTPTTTQASTTYSITISNSAGSNKVSLKIRIGNTTASGVYGQNGSFTTSTANNGGVTANSLNNPTSFFNVYYYSDSYIVDSGNHRVLGFSSTSFTAKSVTGQGGSLSSNTANNGGVSSTSLSSPTSFSGYSQYYVADTGNNRVLAYSAYSSSSTASTVYGQAGSLSSSTANNGGVSASSLNAPAGVTSDYSSLYVADTGNNRVLKYSSTLTTASIVYGQNGSFSSSTANNGGVSASSLNAPSAVFYDSTNSGLYIVDKANNRVLYYSSSSTTASMVFGQSGSYSSNSANNGGISADSLSAPSGVAVDKNKGVYIADTGNNRVLYYPSGSTTATKVFGQNGSFTTATANNGGITASSLNAPVSVSVDYSGSIYIIDSGNNRVLLY